MTLPEQENAASQAPKVAPNFITEIIENDLGSGKYTSIVTRFPPEPSGYAHMGHIFASFLDFQTAAQYGGRYHLRMDDTNPELATQEYACAIAEDLKWLGWDWGKHLYYASDYFEQYYAYAEQLIKQGDAYVDSVSADEMARLRGIASQPGTASKYRSRSIEENLDLFRRMRAGEFEDGAHVLRAKIDLASTNMKLRDPVLYRVLRGNHYRCGAEWCIYPMYDFQHPIQDAIEGVTHSMCSLEFIDNRAIYDWLMEKLGFNPRPHQYEFGRRSIEYTITSKRKLRKLVQLGKVSGWDDPRMPTLRAQRRLGVTPEAVRNFAAQIGVSRTNRTVDISVYENAVRDDLNHKAPRVMAVLEPVRVIISGAEESTLQLPYWPFDVVQGSPDGLVSMPDGKRVAAEAALREVRLSTEIYIERDDFSINPPKGFKRLTNGGTVRLRGVGIIRADSYEESENGNLTIYATLLDEDAKAGGVIHWVSAKHAIKAEFRLYDRLFNVASPETEEEKSEDEDSYLKFLNPNSLSIKHGYVEASILQDPPETRYQFERQGYFWRDPVDSTEDCLVLGRIITLKDTWAKEIKKSQVVVKPETSKVKPESAKVYATKSTQASAEEEKSAAKLISLGASQNDAQIIARDGTLLSYLESAIQNETFAQVASWAVNDLAASVRLGSAKVSAKDLEPLAKLLSSGQITSRVARDVLAKAAASGEDPMVIIESGGLNSSFSEEDLISAIEKVLLENPDKVESYRSGKESLLGFFTGQVMRATSGKAEPKKLNELLIQKLKADTF